MKREYISLNFSKNSQTFRELKIGSSHNILGKNMRKISKIQFHENYEIQQFLNSGFNYLIIIIKL